MMFLKPTRFKVIVTLIIIFIWLLYGYFLVDPITTPSHLPSHFSGETNAPFAQSTFPSGELKPPLIEMIYLNVISVIILLLPIYLIVCVIVIITNKLKKNKKTYTGKSKR